MEYKGIKQNNMGKVILMKLTSRERPEQLLKTVKAYIELANNTEDMVWYFTFDDDDKTVAVGSEFSEGLRLLSEQYKLTFKAFHGNSLNKIDAINRDVRHICDKWDILLSISDDQIPVVKGYDDKIRELMPDDLDASLWFSDGTQPRLNTQEIVGRNYYNRFGYIYHPSYKSLFCDNEAHEVAVKLGKQIKSKECIIKHFHPCHMKGIATDALYQKNESFWNEDEANYKLRKSLNFPA